MVYGERLSLLMCGKFLVSEDTVERSRTELVFDNLQFVSEWRPLEQSNPIPCWSIVDIGPKQSSVAIVGAAAEENPFAVYTG
jgi:hypothetical protein